MPPALAATRPSAGGTTAPPGNAWQARLELGADTVDVQAADTTAHVIVRRKGSLHGDTSFMWWTESGTAKPGRDFAAVIPRVEHIPDGRSSVSLDISVSGTPRTQPKSFYVVIDRNGPGGTALGARTLSMVTLQPAD